MKGFKIKITKEVLFVALILFVSFFVRVYRINTDLLYHRDQGLVAMDIYKIWHDKKISLIGAPTDVDGISHSPLYYWILTPFYFLGRGDIVYPAIFQILLEILSLPFLYFAIKKVFGKETGFISLILYSVSYGLVSYSRWFITVPFILPLANIFLYTLINKKGVFVNALITGMIIQTNAACGVFLIPFLLYHYRKELKVRNLILIFLGVLIPALPLVLFQIRHDFITVRSILNMSLGTSQGIGLNVAVYFKNFITYIKEINHLFLYPHVYLSAAIFFYGLYKLIKSENKYKEIILSFLIIPFLFLGLYQRGAISFFLIAFLPLCLSIISYSLSTLGKGFKYAVLIVIIVLNIFLLKNIYKPTNALIPIGDRNVITIDDRKKVIDFIYQNSNGENFSVWIYTIPYYQDYPWEYLFLTYAKDKYGYLPEKTGSFSKNNLKTSKYFFDIYEVDHDNPEKQKYWFDEVLKNFGKTESYFNSHDIHVEMRGNLR